MTDGAEVTGVLAAVGFVALSAVVLLVVPLKAAASLIPLLLVFLLALYMYLS